MIEDPRYRISSRRWEIDGFSHRSPELLVDKNKKDGFWLLDRKKDKT